MRLFKSHRWLALQYSVSADDIDDEANDETSPCERDIRPRFVFN